MRFVFSILLLIGLCQANDISPKRTKKVKKVKDLGPGPCHDPVHPLILLAKKNGFKAVPLRKMFLFRKLLKQCKKTGQKETVKQLKLGDYKRDYHKAQYMDGWTSNHAMCTSIVVFYYYIGLVMAEKK
tara:strand:+ start:2153 stop:2536 length:384 start_codon:yes stop_codon:yes gene_type:complete